MRLKSLSNKELKEEILWRKIKYMACHYEKPDGLTNEEWQERKTELHDIYKKFYLEAVGRNLVEMPAEL